MILDGILYLQNICHLIDGASSAYVNNVVPIKIWLKNAAKAKRKGFENSYKVNLCSLF